MTPLFERLGCVGLPPISVACPQTTPFPAGAFPALDRPSLPFGLTVPHDVESNAAAASAKGAAGGKGKKPIEKQVTTIVQSEIQSLVARWAGVEYLPQQKLFQVRDKQNQWDGVLRLELEEDDW